MSATTKFTAEDAKATQQAIRSGERPLVRLGGDHHALPVHIDSLRKARSGDGWEGRGVGSGRYHPVLERVPDGTSRSLRVGEPFQRKMDALLCGRAEG